MDWPLRTAREEDAPALERLIEHATRTSLARCYSEAQLAVALGPVFGLDRQLIRDGTYFVIEHSSAIIGCGGWSKRKSLYGGDSERPSEDDMLDPKFDAARIRAFFVHPSWARRGIGKSILKGVEENGQTKRRIDHLIRRKSRPLKRDRNDISG
jgi:GNAT superfamily N-acetyltransferase